MTGEASGIVGTNRWAFAAQSEDQCSEVALGYFHWPGWYSPAGCRVTTFARVKALTRAMAASVKRRREEMELSRRRHPRTTPL
jgi:hypothetical protein